MRIASIRCEGFRSYISPVAADNLRPVTALVGQNNSGKSNLLELLKFMQSPETSAARFDELVSNGRSAFSAELVLTFADAERRALIADLHGDNAPQAAAASLNGFLKQVRHSFTFDRAGLRVGRVLISNISGAELLIWNAAFHPASTGRPNEVEVASMDLPRACRAQRAAIDLREALQTRLRGSQSWSFFYPQTATEPIPLALRQFYEKFRWVEAIRKSESAQGAQERLQLSPNGHDLAQVWNHLASANPDAMGEIARKLGKVVRGVERPGAPLKGNNASIRFGEKDGSFFSLQNAATGTQQAAIILTKLETEPKGGVFMVEEPESHLHPGAQRRLRGILEDASSDQQIFLTTHSTIFGLSSGKVGAYLVKREDGVSSLSIALGRDDSLQLLLELGHSHTDLLGHDFLLCLEGDTEMIAVPRIARAIGADLESLGIGVFNLRGRSGVRRIRELLGYLRTVHVRPFVALDFASDVAGMLTELARQSLVVPQDTVVWPGDFEDLFSPELLSEACAKIGIIGVTPTLFRPGAPAVETLKRFIHENSQGDLDKPALGQAIAEVCESDVSRIPARLSEFIQHLGQSSALR